MSQQVVGSLQCNASSGTSWRGSSAGRISPMMISGPAMETSDSASASSASSAENVSSCSGTITIDHRPSVVAGFGLCPGTFKPSNGAGCPTRVSRRASVGTQPDRRLDLSVTRVLRSAGLRAGAPKPRGSTAPDSTLLRASRRRAMIAREQSGFANRGAGSWSS